MQSIIEQRTFPSGKVLFSARQPQEIQEAEDTAIAINRKTGENRRMHKSHQKDKC